MAVPVSFLLPGNVTAYFKEQSICNITTLQGQGGQTALYAASKNGHLQVVEKLLAHPGIDVNAGGATALYIAAEQVGE